MLTELVKEKAINQDTHKKASRDAKLLVQIGPDAFSNIIDLGNISPGNNQLEFDVLFSEAFEYLIIGSSMPGGDIDIFGARDGFGPITSKNFFIN